MRYLEFGLRRCLDCHHRLVPEPVDAPKILIGDVCVAFVLVQELQLQFGVLDQVVELIQ